MIKSFDEIIILATIFAISVVVNGGILALNIKLYTEIMKEKAQRGRSEG